MINYQFTNSNGFGFSRINSALDFLIIRLGGRCFGLPLSEVRHVCSMPSSFGGYGPETAKHFVFLGDPLPYASLWNWLGLESEYFEYEGMLASLPKRRQEHLDWMNALEDAIRNGTAFTKARNPRECAFGKWYYGYQPKERRLSIMMRQFEKPHADIHRLADRLLGLVEDGQAAKATQMFLEAKETTFAELLKLFDSALKLVTALQRRTAVIVVDGDDMHVLGADGVRDIITVPAERIKPSPGGLPATSALILLDDQNVVPLINWRLLFAGSGTPGVLEQTGLSSR